jgi:hypothetical protein
MFYPLLLRDTGGWIHRAPAPLKEFKDGTAKSGNFQALLWEC